MSDASSGRGGTTAADAADGSPSTSAAGTPAAADSAAPPRGDVRKPVFVIVVLALTVAAALYVRRVAPPPSVNVEVMNWGGAGPGFVALKKGFFGGLHVEIRVSDDTNARRAAYTSDAGTIYLTNPDQHPLEAAMGLPGTMFLLSDVSSGSDGIIARNDIKTLSDLRGRRVAYTHGTASDYLLSKALQSVGLKRSDIVATIVNDPTVATAALRAGDVDAALSWEPLMGQVVKDGAGRIIFTSADAPDTIIGVFIAKDEFLRNAAQFDRFVAGWLRAVDECKRDSDECAQIMAEGFRVSLEEAKGMLAGLKLADTDKNRRFFESGTDGLTPLDRFTTEAGQYWHEIGLLGVAPADGTHWIRDEPKRYFAAR